MVAHQTMETPGGVEVSLFPLPYIDISQADYGTFSHHFEEYYATDFLGYTPPTHAPCYAPVSMELIFLNRQECMGVWQSLEPVLFADGSTDYLGVIVYHDNRYEDGLMQVGMRVSQGDIFNYTGTGGNVNGDHMHLETGKGRWLDSGTSTPRGTAEYKFHFTDYTTVKRIRVFDALYANDTEIIRNDPRNEYLWKYYEKPVTPTGDITRKKFPWVLYARKIRKKR